MKQIHIDSSLRDITKFPQANNFSFDLKNNLKKGIHLKLIGGIFENNTSSNYYKIVISECGSKIDGNIGLSYDFIIINDPNSSGFVVVNNNNNNCQITSLNTDAKTLSIKVYNHDNYLHTFSNDFLLILEIINC
jgi:hypothetical protein